MILGIQKASQMSRDTNKFSLRVPHGAHCPWKPGFGLVFRSLTVQAFSVGCESFLLASTHISIPLKLCLHLASGGFRGNIFLPMQG